MCKKNRKVCEIIEDIVGVVVERKEADMNERKAGREKKILWRIVNCPAV